MQIEKLEFPWEGEFDAAIFVSSRVRLAQFELSGIVAIEHTGKSVSIHHEEKVAKSLPSSTNRWFINHAQILCRT